MWRQARTVCRHIDRVTVKGSIVPVDLYTVDFYSFPVTFGCTCDNPLHFEDGNFLDDESVEGTQENEPVGECVCMRMC